MAGTTGRNHRRVRRGLGEVGAGLEQLDDTVVGQPAGDGGGPHELPGEDQKGVVVVARQAWQAWQAGQSSSKAQTRRGRPGRAVVRLVVVRALPGLDGPVVVCRQVIERLSMTLRDLLV